MPETVSKEKAEGIEEPLQEESPPEAAEKKKSSGLKKIIIVIAATQILAAGGAFMFIRGYLAPKIEQASQEPVEEQEDKSREFGNIYMIENLIVNPAGTNGTRFLSASVGFEHSESSETSHGESGGMERLTPIIRDVLIAVLGSKTMEELSSVEGRELLRGEILEKVNGIVAPDSIYRVYFVEFVLQ